MPDSAKDEPPQEVETYTATGLDNALDLLEVVTAKMDKASVGQQAAGLERHPEVRIKSAIQAVAVAFADSDISKRRFKAAFEAYKERELPKARAEVRGCGCLHHNRHD